MVPLRRAFFSQMASFWTCSSSDRRGVNVLDPDSWGFGPGYEPGRAAGVVTVHDGDARCPVVSGDGSTVAFLQRFSSDEPLQLVLYDTREQAVTRVELPPQAELGLTGCPVLSRSGDRVVFAAATSFTEPFDRCEDRPCITLDLYMFDAERDALENVSRLVDSEWIWMEVDPDPDAMWPYHYFKADAGEPLIAADASTIVFKRGHGYGTSCRTADECPTAPAHTTPIDSWVMLDVESGDMTDIPVDPDAFLNGFSTDGQTALFFGDDIYVARLAEGEVVTVPTDWTTHHSKLAADGSKVLYVGDSEDPSYGAELHLYDVSSGADVALGHRGDATAISDDGLRIAWRNQDGYFIHDVPSDETWQVPGVANQVEAAASETEKRIMGPFLSGDGRRALVATRDPPDAAFSYYVYDVGADTSVLVAEGAYLEPFGNRQFDYAYASAVASPMSADGSVLLLREISGPADPDENPDVPHLSLSVVALP